VSEQAERLKARTMQFALDVSALLKVLPASEPGSTVKRQLAKSATSVAANYRAACRARSHAEFTARMGTVAEEADEFILARVHRRGQNGVGAAARPVAGGGTRVAGNILGDSRHGASQRALRRVTTPGTR